MTEDFAMRKRTRKKNLITEALFSLLSAVPRLISGGLIKKRAERNFSRNKGLDGGRYTSGLIYSQEPFGEMKLGGQRLSECGCEIISVYNAMKIVGKDVSLPSLIYDFERSKCMMWWGYLGLSPTRLGEILYAEKIPFFKTYDINELEENAKSARCIIISCWNTHVWRGLHTFTVRYEDGRLHAYNGYNGLEYGKHVSELSKNNKMIVGYVIK